MWYSPPELAAVSWNVEIDATAYRPERCHISSLGSGLSVVSVPAEVDSTNAHWLRSALQQVCTADSVVIVDMTVTRLLTAAGIGAIAPTGKRLQDAGGELRLVVVNPHVQRVLEVLKMDQLFRIFTNLPEALAIDRRDPLSYGQAA